MVVNGPRFGMGLLCTRTDYSGLGRGYRELCFSTGPVLIDVLDSILGIKVHGFYSGRVQPVGFISYFWAALNSILMDQ